MKKGLVYFECLLKTLKQIFISKGVDKFETSCTYIKDIATNPGRTEVRKCCAFKQCVDTKTSKQHC